MWIKTHFLVCCIFFQPGTPDTSTASTEDKKKTSENELNDHQISKSLAGNKTELTQFRIEERLPNGALTGSYGLFEPDGSARAVHYTADQAGFRILDDKGKNYSEPEDFYFGKDVLNQKMEPVRHLSQTSLIEISKSPLLISAVESLKNSAASSIFEVRERPMPNHYLRKNTSEMYIFIPDKISVRRELEGKKGEFVTEEMETKNGKNMMRRNVQSDSDDMLSLVKMNVPGSLPFQSVMFLLDQKDQSFHSRVKKRELTAQNGQYLTIQQQNNGQIPHTVTYNNHENAPPPEGFYEQVAPKIQDFTQNLANQWANYATKQAPLQPVLNSIPQANNGPYVVAVPPQYSQQTYRYPLNEGASGDYSAVPMNQQYPAGTPVNPAYGPPVNADSYGPPIGPESYGPPPQSSPVSYGPPPQSGPGLYGPPPQSGPGSYGPALPVGPDPYAPSQYSQGPMPQQYNGQPNYGPIPGHQPPPPPMNIEINGAPVGPEAYNTGPSPVNQFGGPPPDMGPPDQQYDTGNSEGGVVLPPGYGQYNGPSITTNPSLTEPLPFNLPPTVPSSYNAPPNIPSQNPYPDLSNSPMIPPTSYPTPSTPPPIQYNNLNEPIQEHLNRLNAPGISQLDIKKFNVPAGDGPDPYIKVVPQEIDPNQYNLFNRPVGKQVGPSSPRPQPTDPEYYTNYNGNPYDPIDTNALKKKPMYEEPDINRHNSYSNAPGPAYDVIHTGPGPGPGRYTPSPSNSMTYSSPPPNTSGDDISSSSPPPLPTQTYPSPIPTATPQPPLTQRDPRTRIIYYDNNIKD